MRYKPGAYIVSLDHLMDQELVYYGGKLLQRGGCIAWGKKIKSVNPKITVLSDPGTELCCLMCGHYAPTLKQWNSEERKKCT